MVKNQGMWFLTLGFWDCAVQPENHRTFFKYAKKHLVRGIRIEAIYNLEDGINLA